MRYQTKMARLKRLHPEKQKQGMRHLVTGIVCLLTLFIYGCNLLGINPVRKESPDQQKGVSNTAADQTAMLEKQKKLLERIEQLEAELQKNQADYENRLINMDRTIALMEKNISEIRNARVEPPLEKTNPTVAQSEKKNPESGQATKEKRVATTLPSPRPSPPETVIPGEIRTPQTSKALETVSLLGSEQDKKKPAVETDRSKDKSLQIGSVQSEDKDRDKKNDQKVFLPGEDAWEDPDLKEPLSPIRLSVVPGAKRRYQEAFKIYSSRNYAESIVQFNRFLADFPDDQDADNSQFWVGQAHFQLGNYLQAERAFRKVLKNYAHGTTRMGYKTPDAALMLGRIYSIRKKPIKARYYFGYVIQRYSDSRSAVKAAREIQAMDSF